jgi:homoserine dehydrogenase
MQLNLAIIGLGGVGRGFAELVADRGVALLDRHDIDLKIVAVSDAFLGFAFDPEGLDPLQLAQLPREAGALAALSGGQANPDNRRAITEKVVDFVLEATVTDPVTGEPAMTHCNLARESGKHFVTSNKGPIALDGRRLRREAATSRLGLDYEGVVMSGTPVLRFGRECLAGCRIDGFRGILNGTSNFMLGRIEAGATFQAALKEAQDLGYAEADPTADIGGSDVRLKTLILAQEFLGFHGAPTDIEMQGIAELKAEDVHAAPAQGRRWKLIGEGRRNADGRILLSVRPIALPLSDPLAGVGGAMNAITFSTDLLGDVTVSGPGAGRRETAFALLSDILGIVRMAVPPRYNLRKAASQ